MAAEGGCRAAAQTQFRGAKKRGVPRLHVKHAAWEPLPQICVVSVYDCHLGYLLVTRVRKDHGIW